MFKKIEDTEHLGGARMAGGNRMDCGAVKIIAKFESDNLRKRATRYLKKYPQSLDHLTFDELRDQVIMHPDAGPCDLKPV